MTLAPTDATNHGPPADRGPAAAGLVVDRELRARLAELLPPAAGAPAPDPAQVQPASVDLRVGPVAHRIRAGFLPAGRPVEERLAELATTTLGLEGEGAVLERGAVYLVPLDDTLALPADLRARFNPRSSTGRVDVFTRVLCPPHPRFDEAPPGWRGRPWLEVAPLSFPVRLRRGDRLVQVRLSRGEAALGTDELRALYRDTPLCFAGERPLGAEELRFDDEGGLELRLGLAGRDPAGWRAAPHTPPVDLGREGVHDPRAFFEPVHAPGGRAILAPGSFYVFRSRERLRVPPTLAAEMLPVDLGLGELRNNYAGFFDSGFGWEEDADGRPTGRGTPAVLEVRAHDVPFQVEDGQVFFRLRFLRTAGRPEGLYGRGRAGGSYRDQDLTLARAFRRP